jgi:hypothetical protein
MQLQVGGLGKTFRTQVTTVGFLAGVHSLVNVEMRGAGKGLGTGGTCVVLQFGVKRHVLMQAGRLREGFIAH